MFTIAITTLTILSILTVATWLRKHEQADYFKYLISQANIVALQIMRAHTLPEYQKWADDDKIVFQTRLPNPFDEDRAILARVTVSLCLTTVRFEYPIDLRQNERSWISMVAALLTDMGAKVAWTDFQHESRKRLIRMPRHRPLF